MKKSSNLVERRRDRLHEGVHAWFVQQRYVLPGQRGLGVSASDGSSLLPRPTCVSTLSGRGHGRHTFFFGSGLLECRDLRELSELALVSES